MSDNNKKQDIDNMTFEEALKSLRNSRTIDWVK